MRSNVIMKMSAVVGALAIGILGFLNVNPGTAQASILGDILNSILNIDNVPVNVCQYNSVDSIVNYVNANNGTDTDVTSSSVLSALGGSLTNYQVSNCGTTNTHTNNPQRIYDSCDQYWANGLYGVRRGSSNYNSRLDTLHTGSICNRDQTPQVDVTGNADCTVSQQNDQNYGLRLNGSIDQYNRLVTDARRSNSPGGSVVTDSEQREIDRFRDRVNTDRDPYNRNLGVLRVDCNQQQSNVTINNQLPASGGTTTVVVPAPSSSSSGSSYTVPKGSAETGDGSTVMNVG